MSKFESSNPSRPRPVREFYGISASCIPTYGSEVRGGIGCNPRPASKRPYMPAKKEKLLDQYKKYNTLAEKKEFIRKASSCYGVTETLRGKLFPKVKLPKIPYGDGVNELTEAIKELSDEDKILYCYMISLEKATLVGEKSEECKALLNSRRNGTGDCISSKELESELWAGYVARHVANRISERTGIKDESTPEQIPYIYNLNYSYNTNMSLLLWMYLRGIEGIFTEFKYAGEKVTLSGESLFSVNYWQKIQPEDAYNLMKAKESKEKTACSDERKLKELY